MGTEKPKHKETGWLLTALGVVIAIAQVLPQILKAWGVDGVPEFNPELIATWLPLVLGGATYRQVEKRRKAVQPAVEAVADLAENAWDAYGTLGDTWEEVQRNTRGNSSRGDV